MKMLDHLKGLRKEFQYTHDRHMQYSWTNAAQPDPTREWQQLRTIVKNIGRQKDMLHLLGRAFNQKIDKLNRKENCSLSSLQDLLRERRIFILNALTTIDTTIDILSRTHHVIQSPLHACGLRDMRENDTGIVRRIERDVHPENDRSNIQSLFEAAENQRRMQRKNPLNSQPHLQLILENEENEHNVVGYVMAQCRRRHLPYILPHDPVAETPCQIPQKPLMIHYIGTSPEYHDDGLPILVSALHGHMAMEYADFIFRKK